MREEAGESSITKRFLREHCFVKDVRKGILLLPNWSATGMIRPRDEVGTRILADRGRSGARGEWL